MATQNKIVSSLYLICKLAGVKLIEGAMLRISPSTLALLPLKGKLICSPKRGFLRDTQEPFKPNTPNRRNRRDRRFSGQP